MGSFPTELLSSIIGTSCPILRLKRAVIGHLIKYVFFLGRLKESWLHMKIGAFKNGMCDGQREFLFHLVEGRALTWDSSATGSMGTEVMSPLPTSSSQESCPQYHELGRAGPAPHLVVGHRWASPAGEITRSLAWPPVCCECLLFTPLPPAVAKRTGQSPVQAGKHWS